METKDLILEHKHPMPIIQDLVTLKEKLKNEGKELNLWCYACKTYCFEPAHFCSKCNIIIHTGCAKLPLQVTYQMHSEHPLLLVYNCPRRRLFLSCRSCDDDNVLTECYTYRCLSCQFYICVQCSKRASEQRLFRLNCHPHPLMVVSRNAYFRCDACASQDHGGFSFICTTCPFWIHNMCARLQAIKESEDHDHPLSLAYCVPEEFRHYNLKCDICCKVLDTTMWVYFCGPCRFFIHIKCHMWKRTAPLDAAINEHDLIRLPCNDMSMNVIRPFMEKKGLTEIQPLEEIQHFSHEHPLLLSSVDIDQERMTDEEILCDGCVEPISSSPYYHCRKCNYLLHVNCAHLPMQLQHPSHPEHELFLRRLRQELGYFYCKSCHERSNGFFFECEACHFQLDLKCAILPTTFAHEAHNEHPLVKTHMLRKTGPGRLCNACGKYISGLMYRCNKHCANFYLHYQCAILPRAVKHRWDKHQLILRYPPFADHPAEFYCEICEEEIHPKHWLYHCSDCDQSFHLFCIPRLGKDRHMKFGNKTLQVNNHQHLLKSVREGKYKSKCAGCGKNLSGNKAYECETCKFSLCYDCACSNPREPHESGILPGQQEDKGEKAESRYTEPSCAIM